MGCRRTKGAPGGNASLVCTDPVPARVPLEGPAMSPLRMSPESLEPDANELDVVRTMVRALPANGLATGVDASVRKVVERPGRAARSAMFVWQVDSRVLVLDATLPGRWVLGELRSGDDAPGYTESFRAAFASPREAMGAMMARALADGEDALVAISAGLDAWYGQRTS